MHFRAARRSFRYRTATSSASHTPAHGTGHVIVNAKCHGHAAESMYRHQSCPSRSSIARSLATGRGAVCSSSYNYAQNAAFRPSPVSRRTALRIRHANRGRMPGAADFYTGIVVRISLGRKRPAHRHFHAASPIIDASRHATNAVDAPPSLWSFQMPRHRAIIE